MSEKLYSEDSVSNIADSIRDNYVSENYQLFNKEEISNNFSVSINNGNLYSDSDSFATYFIKVNDKSTLYFNGHSNSGGSSWGAFYNSSKTFLSGFNTTEQSTSIPSGAYYVRIGFLKTYLNTLVVSTQEFEDYQQYSTRTYKLREMSQAIEDMTQDNRLAYEKYIPYTEINSTDVYVEDTANLPMRVNVFGNVEQDTRSGKNLWKIPDSTTTYGVTYTNNGNGTFNLSGTSTNVIYLLYWFPLSEIEDGATYTLWSNLIPSGVEFRFEEYTALNGSWVKQYALINSTTKSKTITITKSTGTYVRLAIYIYSGTTLSASNIQVQLEKSATATDFEQYGSSPSITYPSEIQLVENCDVHITNSDSSKEQVYSIDTKNRNLFTSEIEQNARKGSDGTTTIYSANYIRTKDMIAVEPNTTYFIDYEIDKTFNGGDIFFYKKDGTFISDNALDKEPKAFTTSSECYYLNFQWYCSSGITPSDISKVQLSKGSQSLEYIENTDTYSFPLYSTSDYYYKQNGNWYVYNEWAYIQLNGTESTWVENASTKGLFQITLNDTKDDYTGNIYAYSNYFKGYSRNDIFTPDYGVSTYAGNRIFFEIASFKENLSGLKTWLAETKPYVIYKLSSPTTTQITNDTLIEQLNLLSRAKSYDEGTNITITSNELSPYLKGKVFLDTSAMLTADIDI